jgi:hypothetical protein
MKRFFEIWQYSHHFVVVCKDSVAVGHTRRFLRRFIEYTLGKVNGHLVWAEAKKKYVSECANASYDCGEISKEVRDALLSRTFE